MWLCQHSTYSCCPKSCCCLHCMQLVQVLKTSCTAAGCQATLSDSIADDTVDDNVAMAGSFLMSDVDADLRKYLQAAHLSNSCCRAACACQPNQSSLSHIMSAHSISTADIQRLKGTTLPKAAQASPNYLSCSCQQRAHNFRRCIIRCGNVVATVSV